jgi:DNA-directed RNA polymerase specialized sigma24 family protein
VAKIEPGVLSEIERRCTKTGGVAKRRGHMDVLSEEWRWSAIKKLQNIRDRYAVGSFRHETADRAIDFLLSRRRRLDGYAAYNALRNARFVILREQRVAPEVVEFDDANSGRSSSCEFGSPNEGMPATGEDLAVASELAQRFDTAANGVHQKGRACLTGLAQGLSQTELARTLGVSIAQASILRARVRASCAELIYPETT